MLSLTLAWMLTAAVPALENDYVLVTRDQAACVSGGALPCGARVIVALDELEIRSADVPRRLTRGEVAVISAGESYAVSEGSTFFEVMIKPDHPVAIAPVEHIAADKNALRYDSADFFVFEERLEPGDTRERHSHSQRVVIQLNRTTLRQWPDGAPERLVETIPERPAFSPPVVHKVRNAGTLPLRGIIIEFKP